MISTRTWHPGLTASAALALTSILMLAIADLRPAVMLSSARPGHRLIASISESGPAAAGPVALALSDLRVPIETADGTITSFAASNGQVRIASLFYTHCPLMCPLTIATMRSIERELTASERARLGMVLLSLDPLRDSPPALAAVRAQGDLDARWLIGRTTPEALSQLSTAFGVRITPNASGVIEHTPALLLLDNRGAVLARTANVTGIDPAFAAALRSALGAHGS